jgi:conjugative transfer region protein (TIGR03748 family)
MRGASMTDSAQRFKRWLAGLCNQRGVCVVKQLLANAFGVIAALCAGCASTQVVPPVAVATASQVLETSAPQAPTVVPSLPPQNGLNGLASDETQVGRYTTVRSTPTQADANPLLIVAKVHFPRQVVSTVGEAIRYVLVRTGYRLVGEAELDARVKAVMAMPLPDHQRVLGPYQVESLLSALMGQAYRLVSDHGVRSVRYVPLMGAEPSAVPATAASAAAS